MDLPLPIDATKEDVCTALKFYATATANMAKDLLENTGSVLQELPMLADRIDQLVSLASNIHQLSLSGTSTDLTAVNIKTDRAVNRLICHFLTLIGAANDLISPIKIEDYTELFEDVYSNSCGVLEACRHLA